MPAICKPLEAPVQPQDAKRFRRAARMPCVSLDGFATASRRFSRCVAHSSMQCSPHELQADAGSSQTAQ
eukprot:CAMPEP_0181203690 /NCGR_PEP_ID=MMETSP1096-20121128/19530_1 /TAXON_ID=156174 ORGANISM="Chrysochromulina ericina, Strain CCMP281" /NCGR_SAMPLE_ID=MMETSP1096 /ASSEMBLY_ACC=CAM_ASM_000453 /LENGTH=68 /DNA_ID=CAMNT_0023294327 /DNA_START=372 /DNA_END=578 /DNA_ORIENTATION=-